VSRAFDDSENATPRDCIADRPAPVDIVIEPKRNSRENVSASAGAARKPVNVPLVETFTSDPSTVLTARSALSGIARKMRFVSVDAVRQFFAEYAPDIRVIETSASTATVALAAQAHGVEPARIAKTLSLWIGGDVILLVTRGDARLDNQKFKARFRTKPRMLDAADVEVQTGHPVGGVCPFALPRALKIYCDVSLKDFDEVLPAAGATNAAVRIHPERLATLVNAEWVDVMRRDETPAIAG
jgi:prolyl-tRNA editing enzyme YbaK/EbsC (Cys-tRNA(Pro) deacylase)